MKINKVLFLIYQNQTVGEGERGRTRTLFRIELEHC